MKQTQLDIRGLPAQSSHAWFTVETGLLWGGSEGSGKIIKFQTAV